MENIYKMDSHANLHVGNDPLTNSVYMYVSCRKTNVVMDTCGMVKSGIYHPYPGDVSLDTGLCDIEYPDLLRHLCTLPSEQLFDVEFMTNKVKNYIRNRKRAFTRAVKRDMEQYDSSTFDILVISDE